MKSIKYIVLGMGLLSNVVWAENEWPIKLTINTSDIVYHSTQFPNALICKYVRHNEEGGVYDALVSQETWVNPKAQEVYTFLNPIYTNTRNYVINTLVCSVKGKQTPGMLIKFICYDVEPVAGINVAEGLSNGQCMPFYL